ncbi:MAG: SDR family NAD(P)-dependent oxidoreductase, partial [Candidatus Riflebacteria bacterium]|nr:SDR family NAD(P)-dependent oxidoreductase [Candidatus Riflebacteria bacterium]
LVTGESVGLRVRQVATPLVSDILAFEDALIRENLTPGERRERFEDANIGNLSRAIASKDGEDGCFMAGEVIALIDGVTTISELHDELFGKIIASPDISGPVNMQPKPNSEDQTQSGNRSVRYTARPSALKRRSFQDNNNENSSMRRGGEAIAVIGLGCTFPGSPDPASFFGNVLAKRCFIRPMPFGRLAPSIFFDSDPSAPFATYSRIGGYLDDVAFDPTLYKIPPRVAARMDLAQKLALICARQAISDAGFFDRSFDRERFAVIIGNSMGGTASVENLRSVSMIEFTRRLKKFAAGNSVENSIIELVDEFLRNEAIPDITEDSLPGELGSLIAGRVSSVFDLHGPNMTIDAACGSGLAAVAVAVDALREGRIDFALAGGIDTQMDPASFIKFSKVTALSAKGSYPFDHRADGFVMAEGAGLFLLERLEDAIQNGDHIYATVLGIGQSSDGRGRGITAPNPDGQRRAIERAWSDAGCDPRNAGYFEAHGTGTRVGDEIELTTLDSIIAGGAGKIPVGSVKAMIGHAKAAAGAAGLLKTILAVNQRIIPPQVGFEHFPDAWKTDAFSIFVPVDSQRYSGETFLAGVSSFGFGGTNHHLVIGEASVNRAERHISIADASPVVAIESEFGPNNALERGSGEDFGKAPGDSRPLTALVFPGQGSQYPGMLSTWRKEPEFDAVMHVAEDVFRETSGEPLSGIIWPESGDTDQERAEMRLRNTRVAQPALFAVSAGLLEVARSRGLAFDIAFGHSLGEYSALFAAGALRLEDALRAVCIRAQYMSALPDKDLGAMGVIGLPVNRVVKGLTQIDGYVVPANMNSPRQTVISGATASVEAALSMFDAQGVLARRLKVSAAFHSSIVSGAVPQFREALMRLDIQPLRVRVPANITGEWYPDPGDSCVERVIDLLTRQVVSPVDFINQIERAWKAGVRRFVEVGPKNILCRLIDEILGDRPHICVPLDNPRESGREQFDKAMRTLSGSGATTISRGGQGAATRYSGSSGLLAKPAGPVGDPLSVSARRALPEMTRLNALLNNESSGKNADIEAVVMEVIEDVSGYPRSMIQPDADLEAELGIDTLKIFEIASRLKTTFGGLSGMRLDLSRLRTFASIVSLMREGGADVARVTGVVSVDSASSAGIPGTVGVVKSDKDQLRHESASSADDDRFRHELEWAHALLPGPGSVLPPELITSSIHVSGKVVSRQAAVKTSGNEAFDHAMMRAVSARGFEPVIWCPTSGDFDMLEAGEAPDALRGAALYVHPIASARFSRKTRKRFYREDVLSLFLVARALGRGLSALLVPSDCGGDPTAIVTRSSPGFATSFLSGVIPAFCQALEKDFPGLVARGVDLPAFTPELAELSVDAALRPGFPALAGLAADGRMVFRQLVSRLVKVDESQAIESLRGVLSPRSVVLATGGGSGITACIVRRLAREFRPRLIILGRAIERTAFLSELRALGSEAVYMACDLADGPAVDRVAAQLRAPSMLGSDLRIDLLIHGAGIEHSRHLSGKTPAEIDAVYRVKVAGLVNLLDAIGEESIGAVVNFSSVASLFGNPGQVDYAAANGFLNAFRGSGLTRFLSIAWSAWNRVGMAAHGAIHEILEAGGVEFIEPERGERFFLRELYQMLLVDNSQHRTVACFGRLGAGLVGPDEGGAQSRKGQGGGVAVPSEPGGQFNGVSAFKIVVQPDENSWLWDHAIGGRILLPAVFSLSEMVSKIAPKSESDVMRYLRIDDIAFHAPVKLARGETVSLEGIRDGSSLDLWAEWSFVAGEGAFSRRRHLTCRPSFIDPSTIDRQRASDDVERLLLLARRELFTAVGDTPSSHPQVLTRTSFDATDMYKILFHGPSFQVLKRVERFDRRLLIAEVADPNTLSLNGAGVRHAWARRSAPDVSEKGTEARDFVQGIASDAAVDANKGNTSPLASGSMWPFLLEAALHAAGALCLVRVETPRFFLPSRISRLDIDLEAISRARGGGKQVPPQRVFAEFIGRRSEKVAGLPLLFLDFNVRVVEADGRPLISLSGLRMVAGPDEPSDKSTFFPVGLPGSIAGTPVMGVTIEDAARFSESKAALDLLLSSAEHEIFAALHMPKRRQEWLAGRIAGKLLIRELLLERVGTDVPLTAFSIVGGAGKRPQIEAGQGLASALQASISQMHVSIAHGGGIAMVAIGEMPIGIDVEERRAIDEETASEFMRPEELVEGRPGKNAGVAPGDRVALWTAKEAVSKTVGMGFGIADFKRIALSGFCWNEPYEARLYTPEGSVSDYFEVISFKDGCRVAALARTLRPL